ncbi:MAG: ABC transporter permease [Actinomycetota bacterium]|nr:ABC transporter permease [Actinomycetota bacterium]
MRRVWRYLRGSPLLLAGTVMLSLLLLVALLAPLLAPYDPRDIRADPYLSPSSSHLLGTDGSGHDVLSRVIWGTRRSFAVAVGATAIILVIGMAVGLTAGLRGGWVDAILMRVVDVFLALPTLPLLIFLAALAGGASLTVSIFMIGLFLWPDTARIVRSQTLTLRTRGFVDSARGFGAGPRYIMRRHLVPALGPLIGSNLVYVAGLVVFVEAGLAFIGLSELRAVGWGADMNEALENIRQINVGARWVWLLLPPGSALTLAVLGFTFIGVGLEPEFNPRAQREKVTR